MVRLPFLHKINQVQQTKSYGIHVAKIAGLPADLLKRADSILTQLESQGQESPIPTNQNTVNEQMSLFDEKEENPILTELANIDVYNITPMQAMNLLLELKQKL